MVPCGTQQQIPGFTGSTFPAFFSLKCISRNDRVTNQNAKPVAVAAVEDCRSDWVVSTVEVTELKPETEKAVVGLFRWKSAV